MQRLNTFGGNSKNWGRLVWCEGQPTNFLGLTVKMQPHKIIQLHSCSVEPAVLFDSQRMFGNRKVQWPQEDIGIDIEDAERQNNQGLLSCLSQ